MLDINQGYVQQTDISSTLEGHTNVIPYLKCNSIVEMYQADDFDNENHDDNMVTDLN